MEFLNLLQSHNIDAMVCIGGMEGVESEFEIFRKHHPENPIFLLRSTSRASKILADNFSNEREVSVADDIDFHRLHDEKFKENYPEKFDIISYSFITALIVKEVIERGG